MLLSVLGTLGWVFRCVGFVLESFRHFYFTDLAYGREQKCLKRVLEMKMIIPPFTCKDIAICKQMFKPSM
jgi:hypothetical protein